jgi:hypothetical protein
MGLDKTRVCAIVLLVSCAPDGTGGAVRGPPTDSGATVTAPHETGADHDTASETGAPDETEPTESETERETEPDSEPGCPPGMANLGAFCIDRWEAHLVAHSPYEVPDEDGIADAAEGVMPQGYISGDVAAAACDNAGKRLCTVEEWMYACEGEEARTYPYGDAYDPDACNDTRSSHPVVDYWGDDPDMWDSEHMNDPGINQQPDTVDPAGANPDCVTPDGVYDLHGNLHEWVSDPDGTFKGGFYVDAVINGAGCSYTTTAHGFTYHDYSTGFRCCW